MIVTPEPAGLRLVTQPDHARLAADILALWRSEGLPDHPRRRELLAAVTEHDNGWRETDAAPRIDSRGGPVDFRDLGRDERFTLWRRGLDRLAATPYAAALVAHHALEIHRDRPPATWGAFFHELESRRAAALEGVRLDLGELAADYRYLDLCDTISLVACGAFGEARCRGHHIRRLADTVELDPFPLAGATSFRLPGRTIGPGPYRSATDLVTHLAAARWVGRRIRLAPPTP